MRLLFEAAIITTILLWLLISTCLAGTNHYHAAFAWTAVTNADAYAVIARQNSIIQSWTWTASTSVVVSNIAGGLDGWKFTCVASNVAGLSDESNAALLGWMTVNESDSISGPWTLLATNSFAATAPQHYIALSNWSAASLLKRD